MPGLFVGLVLQIVLYFVIGEVAPKTYAIQNPDRAALRALGVPLGCHELPAAAAAVARSHRPRERHAAGQGPEAGPVRHRGRPPHDGRRRRRRGGDRARGAPPHPLDLRVRRHGRARGHAAAPGHGGDRLQRDGRGGDRARDRGRVLAHPLLRGRHRQHHRDRVPEGSRAPLARRRRERPGARRGARSGVRPGVRSASPSCCARCARRSSTWRSSWTSTAVRPGSSRSRTCSRRSSARSSTSTTPRSPASSRWPAAGIRAPGRTPIDEVNEVLGIELPDTEWDTVGGLVFNLLGHVPEAGETVKFQGLEFRTERVEGRRIASVRDRPDRGQPAGRRGRADEGRAPTRRRQSVACRDRTGVPLGVRQPRRPTERGEVHAREPDRRLEGLDRLEPAADDPHADPRRAHHSRVADRPARHARASTSRARCSGSGATAARCRRSAEVDVVCLLVEANAVDRRRRPLHLRARAPGRARRACSCVNKTDVASHAEVADHLGRVTAELGRLRGVRPALGAHR